jgi:hypothetical protein
VQLTGSAVLGFEQQLCLNRPNAGHETIHLSHVSRLVLGRLGLLPRIRAVSLPVSRCSDLHVKRVLSSIQAAQLLRKPDLIGGDEVPRRDHESPLHLS